MSVISFVRPIFWILVGSSTWLIINSVYVQLGLFMTHFPRFASVLPSVISILIQLSNIFPLLYVLFIKHIKCEKNPSSPNYDQRFTGLALMGNFLLGMAMVIFIKYVDRIDQYVGFAILMIFCFLGGGIATSSNVLFWPFASQFHEIDMTSVSVGTAFSGLFPAFFSIIQKLVQTHYTLEFNGFVFFVYISGITFLSCVSFLIIVKCLKNDASEAIDDPEENLNLLISNAASNDDDVNEDNDGVSYGSSEESIEIIATVPHQKFLDRVFFPRGFFEFKLFDLLVFPLLTQFCISLMYFFLVSSPASLNPYLAKQSEYTHTLQTIITSGMLAAPLGRCICFSAIKISNVLVLILQIASFCSCLIVSHGLTLQNDNEQNVEHSVWVIYCLYAFQCFCFGLNNTSLFKQTMNSSAKLNPKQSSRHLGIVEQLGSSLAALISFVLSIFHVFG